MAPFFQGKLIGHGHPISMNFEICGSIRGYEKQLQSRYRQDDAPKTAIQSQYIRHACFGRYLDRCPRLRHPETVDNVRREGECAIRDAKDPRAR